MTIIDRALVKQIREEVNAALESVAKKHDITLEIGRITYSDNHFDAKLKGRTISEDGVDEHAKQEFEVYASRFGVKPEAFGAEFNLDGTGKVEVSGIKPRSRSYPILVTVKNGPDIGSVYKVATSMLPNSMQA